VKDAPTIPKNWTWVKVDKLVEPDAPVLYGILQPGKDTPYGVPYVRPTEIENDVIQLDKVRRTTDAISDRYRRSRLSAGDILLSIVGTIGKVAVVPKELDGGNITQSSVRIRAECSLVENRYLAWALRSPILRAQFDEKRLGTAVPRLNVEHVRELNVPVASVREQRRIVAKIEELFSDLDAGVVALERVRANLKRYRAAVLKAAVEGKLTEDWRAQHPDIEPATVLVERIVSERRRQWETDQLAKFVKAGEQPPKPHHSQFSLLSFFAANDETAKTFLLDEFRIAGLDSVLFALHEPYWNKRSSIEALPLLVFVAHAVEGIQAPGDFNGLCVDLFNGHREGSASSVN
jgi:hypothetical protein